MKLLNILSAFAISCLLTFSSCDVIDKPYTEKPDTTTTDTADARKMLLEDYTGYKCTNCPQAAEIIHSLFETYNKGNLIVVAVHSGDFAEPGSAPFTYDFRVKEGKEWNSFFAVSEQGNPNGLINRIGYKDAAHIIAKEAWAETLFGIKDNKADMKIDLSATYSASENKIKADVAIKYINAGKSNHKVVVLVTEDSIVDAQIDAGITKTDYVHNHVLRAVFNGAWGTQLSTTDIAAGTTINKSFELTIPNDTKHPWRPEKLKIVAFVHDDGDTYEVLQVEETSLKAK